MSLNVSRTADTNRLGNNVLAEDDQAQQTITVVQVAITTSWKADNSTPRAIMYPHLN
jgi:hypothetical protein